jgi:hypothetical protein
MTRFVRRATARLASLLAAALLSVSCGGGGGEGGNTSNASVTPTTSSTTGSTSPNSSSSTGTVSTTTDLRFALDRSSIVFDYREDLPPEALRIVGTATGTLPSAVYVLVGDESGSIDPSIPASFDGNTATFTLRPKSGLAPGIHSGRLQFMACSDVACVNRIGGTPLAVAYSITVRPAFKVEPTSLRITSVGGQSASAAVNVQLPSSTSEFTVVPGSVPAWLIITPSTGRLDLATRPWRSGMYFASLEVLAGSERRFVPMTFDVTLPSSGERDLSVAPASLTLSTSENAVSAAQSVTVNRPSWAPGAAVLWRIEYASGGPTGWLRVTDSTGGISVAADASALRQGNYRATVVLEPAQPGMAVRLPVAATVGPGLVAPAAVAMTADAESTATTLRGQWTIQAFAGPAFTWRASSNQPWLRLAAASGSTGSALAYSIDTAAMASLENFADHTATVSLTPDPTHITPVTVQVVLSKRLPEVHAIGPQLLLTQRATTMFVSGRGFNAIGSPSARLQVAGLTPNAVTRLNDRTLQVSLTPATPGTAAVTVSNALGQAQPAVTLRSIAAQTFAYAAVPSGGNPRTIVLDPARSTVYGVNVDGESLQRFRLQNGSWILDAKPVPQILDAGMSADGESVVVTATPGRLRLVDPATLATTFTHDHARGFARNLTNIGFGITATHDGRAWLSIGDGGLNELGYFDLRTRRVEVWSPESPIFHGGPWMAVSRDGSRMILVQTASSTPAPPMLGYAAASGALTPEASGQTYSYDIHLSADGSRAIFDAYEVRDRSSALIGRVSLAAFPRYYGVAGLMSPEGHRAYVLAMHEDPAVKPRVFVFDTRAASATSVNLTLVGQFDLQHDPTCRTIYDCNQRARAAISPDGATLFFLGSQHLVVQPVSASLRTLSKAAVPEPQPAANVPLLWKPAAP